MPLIPPPSEPNKWLPPGSDGPRESNTVDETKTDELSGTTHVSATDEPSETDELSGTTHVAPDEIIRRAQEAWGRLAADRTWEDWLAVGEALALGRAEAMRDAYTNEPKGKRYCGFFGAWLKNHHLDAIDGAARSRILDCLDRRAEIEAWRAKLPMAKRLQLNHPAAVLRNWKKSLPPDSNKSQPADRKPTLREAHAEALEKIDRLEREIERGGGDLWAPKDTARQIARAVIDRLPSSKAEKIARELSKLAAEKKKREDAAKKAAAS
jgi:hypothetical protein